MQNTEQKTNQQNMSIKVLLNQKHQLISRARKIDEEIWETLKKKRTKMEPKIYKILKARLHEKKTLEEVAREWGVTRERIRQLEHRGMIVLDNPTSSN